MTRWPHQLYALEKFLEAIHAGQKRICLTSPTGGGKTVMLADIATAMVARDWAVWVLTNRKLLVEQLEEDLTKAGIAHGVRAAGRCRDHKEMVQISSIDTERSRLLSKGIWERHGKGKRTLVIVDEAHLNTGDTVRCLVEQVLADKGILLGLTATPIGLFPMYTHLIQAGTTSALRKCGALVLAHHYGVDEPDLARLRKGKERHAVVLGDDLTHNQQVQAMMTPTIMARVLEWYLRLNPAQKPTLLFGPGKGEALWFAEQLHAAGIPTAHIDGEVVWIRGELYRTSENARQDVAGMSRDGTIKVVTSRFVLREGVNWPWIEHLIMAFVAGSLQTYLQVGGRGLRASPASWKTHLTVQDHGGSWHRHGSLNDDREWHLEWTGRMYAAVRAEQFRGKKPGDAPEPGRCPRCARIMAFWRCLGCGYELPRGSLRSRPVVEIDGSLKEMRGAVYKPRIRMAPGAQAQRLWESMYHRARSEKWDATFAQAEAMFASENGWQYPPRGLPLMPVRPEDWCRKVRDVPMEQLTPKREVIHQ